MQHIDNNVLANKINRHLVAILCFPGLKIFSNGLQLIARLTTNEYRNLIKVMIFVIDNLYDDDDDTVENFVNNYDLVELYQCWNEMYILSRSEEFSESDLVEFNVSK